MIKLEITIDEYYITLKSVTIKNIRKRGEGNVLNDIRNISKTGLYF